MIVQMFTDVISSIFLSVKLLLAIFVFYFVTRFSNLIHDMQAKH